MIASLFRHLRQHGLRRTISAVFERLSDLRDDWIDASFDRKYGTDTSGIIDDMRALSAPIKHRDQAHGYQGIQLPAFRKIFFDLDISPDEFSFIDFGSGKGRAVMLAAEKPFKAVHGVEFSPVLHRIAQQNVALFRQKSAGHSPITLQCQDAVDFEIPEGNLVCFFYNPFDGQLMAKVLHNLVDAYAKQPRRLLIAYRNPVCAYLFDEYPFLRQAHIKNSYRIYAAEKRSS